MGYATAPETRDTLANFGIRVSGYRWRWGIGLKGGTFPPHRHINGQVRSDEGDFEALPGEDVNGDSCMCNLVPAYRTQDGKLARPNNLVPIFQPPVTAAQVIQSEPLDLTPLYELLAAQPSVQVTIPDGAIVVNVPQQAPPTVNVDSPTVNVAAPNVNVQPPKVTVQSPVTVEPTVVNVKAPTVENTVEPAPVKVTTTRVGPKQVTFTRGSDGRIESAQVTG
jgi:hypothetical protein